MEDLGVAFGVQEPQGTLFWDLIPRIYFFGNKPLSYFQEYVLDFFFSRRKEVTRSARNADSYPPIARPLSFLSPSPWYLKYLPSKVIRHEAIPNSIMSRQFCTFSFSSVGRFKV